MLNSYEKHREIDPYLEAHVVKGYAEIKAGNFDVAEKNFMALSKMKGEAKILGDEGLAVLYSHKGDTEKALSYADKVEHLGKNPALPYVVKGGIYFSRNNIQQAQTQYQIATKMKEAKPEHVALAFNQLGRILSLKEGYEKSRKQYSEAIEIDPFLIEATPNKKPDVQYERLHIGDLEKHNLQISLLRSQIHELQRNQNELLYNQKSFSIIEKIQSIINQDGSKPESKRDLWTSLPRYIALFKFEDMGLGLTAKLSDELRRSGAVTLVNMSIISKTLEKLYLNYTHFSNENCITSVGKILTPKVLITGQIRQLSDSLTLSLKMIDVDTTEVKYSKIYNFKNSVSLDEIRNDILYNFRYLYPIRGYVIKVENNNVLLNIGSKQGIVIGSNFQALKERSPIEYQGKKYDHDYEPVGIIRITKIENNISYGTIVKGKKIISVDMKVKESIDEGG